MRSDGNGGTAGTLGSATVGTAGTAGTCGSDGTAGIGTDGGTWAAVSVNALTAFPTAETTGAATGATPDATASAAFAGEATASAPDVATAGSDCVLVSWPTRLPLVSTVAITSTLTVRTLVAGLACRR